MTFSISKTRELCDAATEGPWTVDRGEVTYGDEYWFLPGTPQDAAFIAHARTALPQALDEIERLTRERDEAVGLLRDMMDPFAATDKVVAAEAFLSRHKEG